MHRYINHIVLAALLVIAGITSASVIKEGKQGKSIEFYTNESGTTTKKAEITPEGALRVDKIESLDGLGTPPGQVPVGGMVAVMPTLHANAWQPGATGEIKDGFMRADGHAITAQNVTDGSLFPESTILPNMVDKFTRGAATSGSSAGSNSITPTGTNSGSAFTGNAATRSDWFKNQSISATNPPHFHSEGSGTGLTVDDTTHTHTVNKSSWNGDQQLHNHQTSTAADAFVLSSGGTAYAPGGASGQGFPMSGYYTSSESVAWNSALVGTSNPSGFTNGISGTIGLYNGGVDGNIAQQISFNGNNDNMIEWAAIDNVGTPGVDEGSYTPSGSISQPAFTGDSQTNMPEYNTVVWVIRVK